MPAADVAVVVEADGSVRVTEQINYAFDGAFSGGYREIPLRPGEAIDEIAVSEAGVAYAPGASAELGSSGAPGTFGVADLGGRVRIVWHYAAADEGRIFTLSYRLRGLAIAY
ncbi:MAG: putative rane protein, partial [Acidobacteria bacterium]|nr:putative rane protein [Acidobacteriota bacterium]